MIKLYHKEVFWKNNFDNDGLKLSGYANRLSRHLKDHLNNPDIKHNYTREDVYDCLDKIKQNKGYLFEVEEDNNEVTKAVYRVKLNNKYDMCIVIRPYLIATAWINKADDKHFTLNTAKYTRA